MSCEKEQVARAKEGDLTAFEALVVRYQRRAFGLAMGILQNAADAEEAVQETFLKAFLSLRALRKPEAFGSWLFTICRNKAVGFLRARRPEEAAAVDAGEAADPRAAAPARGRAALVEWEGYFDSLRAGIGMLRPKLREALQLRFFAGLSIRETAAVLGISQDLVKTRLRDAKRKLALILPSLYEGVTVTMESGRRTMEDLMKTIDFTRNGAYVFERLSLAEQEAMCRAVKEKAAFDEALLAAIGRVKGGVEMVAQCKGRLDLKELIDVLNYVDQMTERRIIEHLEETDNAFAETIKQNMFIFEDLTLFDMDALRLLISRVKEGDLVLGLSSTIPEAREHILSAMPEGDRERMLRSMAQADSHSPEITRARYAVVEECRRLDWEHLIKWSRDQNGRILFTVPK